MGKPGVKTLINNVGIITPALMFASIVLSVLSVVIWY